MEVFDREEEKRYYTEKGRRCIRCDRLLNDRECERCGKKHGKEYKNTGICEECLFGDI